MRRYSHIHRRKSDHHRCFYFGHASLGWRGLQHSRTVWQLGRTYNHGGDISERYQRITVCVQNLSRGPYARLPHRILDVLCFYVSSLRCWRIGAQKGRESGVEARISWSGSLPEIVAVSLHTIALSYLQ